MANVTRPNGLTPVRHLTGGTPQRANEYTIADAYATALYSGQPVATTGTGRNIAAAAATTAAVGVFAGCSFQNLAGDVVFSPYWPAAQAIKANSVATAYVYDDPDTVFEVQADTIAEADIGQTYDFVLGTGSAVTGRSATTIDDANKGTGQVVRAIGLARRADNDYGAFAKVEVVFAQHELIARGTAV